MKHLNHFNKHLGDWHGWRGSRSPAQSGMWKRGEKSGRFSNCHSGRFVVILREKPWLLWWWCVFSRRRVPTGAICRARCRDRGGKQRASVSEHPHTPRREAGTLPAGAPRGPLPVAGTPGAPLRSPAGPTAGDGSGTRPRRADTVPVGTTAAGK